MMHRCRSASALREAVGVVFLLGGIVLSTAAQDWELAKNKDGIKVYTKELEHSSIDAFKGVMYVKTTVERMDFILHNLDQHKEIFPDTEELKILERGEDWLIQYSLTNAPWPADDRDGIYKMTFSRDQKTGALYSIGKSMPDYLPEKESVVRIPHSISQWRVIPEKDGLMMIEYEVEAKPGGNIPDWLANTATTEVPYNTLYNLREVLKNN